VDDFVTVSVIPFCPLSFGIVLCSFNICGDGLHKIMIIIRSILYLAIK
jgi:hypothetical protein